MLLLEGAEAGRISTPPICQPRPLLQNWTPSNLLTPVLTKINSQVASPRESLGAGVLRSGREFQELSWAPMSSHHSNLPAYGLQFPHVSKEQGGAAYLERSFLKVKPKKGPVQDLRAGSELESSILRLAFPISFSQWNHNIFLPLNSPWALSPFYFF